MFVLLLAVLLIAACATSEPAPPPEGEIPPPPPPAGDTVWERIQASGVMRVGTAADYKPYEYYVSTDVSPVMDGFDIALIKEVGAKLGVSVEITDFAFEGLSAAVQLGQVDAVIAALSVTEERQALFDFSNVYFSGVGVTLATEASGLEAINTPQEMAGKRVGVQKSSVYETWAQQELVSTGLIAPDQLFTYVKPEHAVSDLTLGRLDIVLMDKQPALQYVNDVSVRIVGEDVNPQIFAIALPNGATELQARINQALTELQNEGVTSQLAMDYLGVLLDDTLPPVPPETPGPPPTPGGCYDGMAFASDLTIPDGTEMHPSTPFEKGWLIENVGTCTWDETYSLDYVYGESQMGGKRTYLHEEVSPGEQYEMYVDMQTPSEPGEYAGFWQLFSGAGIPFGETLWVAIEVTTSSGATATPEACVIHSFTATPSELKVGGSLIVEWSWTCDSVAKSRLSRTDPDGTVVPLLGGGDVPNPGTYDDIAAKVGTMTYYLKVDSEFGASAEQWVSVIVTE
jgi:polar amino acid transport system substrate-binding protein